jgi:2-desacetyl-2-hydroxyethyl bacteriochlorophyllide A dehydrogenase
MKCIVCAIPGTLEYVAVKEPVEKKGFSILRIRRVGVCGTDLHAFEGTQPYFNYPRVLGHELAGTIEQTGPDSGFALGESVTIIPYFNCGDCIACRNSKPNCCVNLKVCGVHEDGGMTEYFSVPDYSLVHSNGLTLDALALVEPLSIGAHAIQRALVREGETVLVVGAGPIGAGTMEFARIAGANVIALDVNDKRLEFVREKLGIANTLNGRRADINEALMELTRGNMPDVVIDATGNRSALEKSFQYISHGGRYLLVGLQKENISFSHPEFHKREATLMSSRNATRSDFVRVIQAMSENFIKPDAYITHRLSFDEVTAKFASLLDPENGVVKGMISI